jgi:hypothetical protein
MRREKTVHLVFSLLVLVLVGCSSDRRVAVTGTVSLDGKPLDSGQITFRPAPNNASNSSGGPIENGQFCIAANHGLCPGKYVVTVQAFKVTGRMVMERDNKVKEVVPITFKEAGKLEADVTAGGKNHFDFPLTSVGSI